MLRAGFAVALAVLAVLMAGCSRDGPCTFEGCPHVVTVSFSTSLTVAYELGVVLRDQSYSLECRNSLAGGTCDSDGFRLRADHPEEDVTAFRLTLTGLDTGEIIVEDAALEDVSTWKAHPPGACSDCTMVEAVLVTPE